MAAPAAGAAAARPRPPCPCRRGPAFCRWPGPSGSGRLGGSRGAEAGGRDGGGRGVLSQQVRRRHGRPGSHPQLGEFTPSAELMGPSSACRRARGRGQTNSLQKRTRDHLDRDARAPRDRDGLYRLGPRRVEDGGQEHQRQAAAHGKDGRRVQRRQVLVSAQLGSVWPQGGEGWCARVQGFARACVSVWDSARFQRRQVLVGAQLDSAWPQGGKAWCARAQGLIRVCVSAWGSARVLGQQVPVSSTLRGWGGRGGVGCWFGRVQDRTIARESKGQATQSRDGAEPNRVWRIQAASARAREPAQSQHAQALAGERLLLLLPERRIQRRGRRVRVVASHLGARGDAFRRVAGGRSADGRWMPHRRPSRPGRAPRGAPVAVLPPPPSPSPLPPTPRAPPPAVLPGRGAPTCVAQSGSSRSGAPFMYIIRRPPWSWTVAMNCARRGWCV